MPSRRLCLKRLNIICERARHMPVESSPASIENQLDEVRKIFAEYQQIFDLEPEIDADESLDDEFIMVEDKVNTAVSSLLERKPTTQLLPIADTTSATLHQFLEHQSALLSTITDQQQRHVPIKTALPKFKIPTFSGCMHDWVSFRDLFRSTIDQNEELTDIQRMQYLRNCVSGEAASLVKTIPISQANYAVAWKTLLDAYDKDSYVVESILTRFHNCAKVSPNQANPKETYNIFRETFEMLQNQGEYANSRDPLAIFLMVQKLDPETDLAWAKFSNKLEKPSLSDFLGFLKNYCTIVERKTQRSQSKPFLSSAKTVKSVNLNAITQFTCFFCSDPHSIYRCSKFLALDVAARERFITSNSRCFICLSKGHSKQSCSSTKTCTICKKKHNSLLHYEGVSSKTNSNSPKKSEISIPVPSSSCVANPRESKISEPEIINKVYSICASSSILPTAIVNLVDIAGRIIPARALLDTGAQTTVISETMMKRLMLPRERMKVAISSLVESTRIDANGRVKLEFRSRYDSSVFHTSALIVPRLSGFLPQTSVKLSSVTYLREKFELADPKFNEAGDIHLILSSSFLFAVLKPSLFFVNTDKLYVQDSRLGFLVCNASDSCEEGSVNAITFDPDHNTIDQVEKFWQLEEVPPLSTCLIEDDHCEKYFRETTSRLPSGRFCVRLPFKYSPSQLGLSYNLAQLRLCHLERKFISDANFQTHYQAFMEDYERRGHMVVTDYTPNSLPNPHYIIPHQGIWQRGPTEKKLRVVFDASSKTSSGKSLNDLLHCGPRLQADIIDVLASFRKHKYVFTTDIEKMYRQTAVHTDDQNYQLILWRESPSKIPRIYKLTTVTYGESSSPFLALRVLSELALQKKQNFPRAAEILTKSRYVDDIFFGHDSIEELRSLKTELTSLLLIGGFELRKWASNVPELLGDVENDHLADPLLLSEYSNRIVKTLGISWCPKSDSFSYMFPPSQLTSTSKRSLLSETATFYDPMGWISPIILSYKALFQETWIHKVDWDSPLPPAILSRWENLRVDRCSIGKIIIPRHIGSSFIDIHGFADASKVAYAAVIYARVLDQFGKLHVKLLISKTKLAPIKVISIPRLELCAAHLLAKLMDRMKSHFDTINGVTFWSDSTTVLAWLKSLPRKWCSFVANRVGHIHELCTHIPWRYVKSSENPADIASRGATASQLSKSELWWHGPSFLSYPELQFTTDDHFETSEEIVTPKVYNCIQVNNVWINFISRFSNLNRLLRSMSYIFRFITMSRRDSVDLSGQLTTIELRFARDFLIKEIQKNEFSAEIFRAKNHENLKLNSVLRKLSPYVDSEGILRVGGRLQNSPYDHDQIHPIILPRCHFTDLILRQTHMENFHSGLTLTCAQIRKYYWILHLQRSVKSLIHKCVRCRRYQGDTFQPPMGSLPTSRVEALKPFLNTGLDFGGPISIRPYRGKGNITLKGYIAVFVCLSTKAIHLELVMNLTTEALIMAIRRFLARRGQCTKLISDNGRNFVGAKRAIDEHYNSLRAKCNSSEVTNFLANQTISWEFIPRYSPHFGGIWEAAVKSTKRHLSKTFNGCLLTIEDLQTALCQIEAVLNSRPLIPLTIDEALQPITPQQLLTGDATSLLSEMVLPSDSDCVVRRRQLVVQTMIEQFWKKWREEYLHQLIPKEKWTRKNRSISVGEIVLIKRSFDPPSFWNIARVKKLYPGGDNVSRVVDVQTSRGVHRESVRNLVPLNVDETSSTGGSMLEENAL